MTATVDRHLAFVQGVVPRHEPAGESWRWCYVDQAFA